MNPRPYAGRTTWAVGLAVALGAAVATAHGLYEVARAAGVPTPIAGLYPLICDGLALVAYASVQRLYGPGRRYAWTIVVLAAGLSGLAQATYLAGSVSAAPTWLRAGVGAWPATAAAITAHLLHLLGSSYEASFGRTPSAYDAEQPLDAAERPAVRPDETARDVPAGDRARAAARHHRARHGVLPTATELMRLADVARGTAGVVLKQLRAEAPTLRAVDPAPRSSE